MPTETATAHRSPEGCAWEVFIQEVVKHVLCRERTVPAESVERALGIAEAELRSRGMGEVIVTIRFRRNHRK